MSRFLLRRIGGSLLVLLGLSVLTFLLARVVPSNAAAVYIGPRARPADIARVTQLLGLDQPLPVQYLTYMRQMLTGDWGISIGTKRPVLDEILNRLPATLELIAAAMLIAIPVGIALGILSARWTGRPPDAVVRLGTLVGVAHAGLLPGVDPAGHLLPLAGRAAAGRPRGRRPPLHRAHRADHRLPRRRRAAGAQRHRLRGRDVAPRAARADPGRLPHRAHRAHDASLHAGDAGPRPRAHGPGLRHQRAAHREPPRAAQRAAAGARRSSGSSWRTR